MTDEQREIIEKLAYEIPELTRKTHALLPPIKRRAILPIIRGFSTISIILALPDDALLTFFTFLNFEELATCLRVNKFFQREALNSTVQDKYIFLNKDKTFYLNLQISFKDKPLKLCHILAGRNKALSISSFWQREKTKLDKVPTEIKKLGVVL